MEENQTAGSVLFAILLRVKKMMWTVNFHQSQHN